MNYFNCEEKEPNFYIKSLILLLLEMLTGKLTLSQRENLLHCWRYITVDIITNNMAK